MTDVTFFAYFQDVSVGVPPSAYGCIFFPAQWALSVFFAGASSSKKDCVEDLFQEIISLLPCVLESYNIEVY